MQYNAMQIVGLERKRRESGIVTRRIGLYVEAAVSLEVVEAQLERIFFKSRAQKNAMVPERLYRE
jgi:hypothetical protein